MPTAQAASLFNSVPPRDHFGLLNNGNPDWKKIVRILDLKKAEVSNASNTAFGNVRYDEKMPDELRERLTEWATAINLVGCFFNDDEKTLLWFRVPNPALGGMSPRDMIRIGRFRKLLRFIQTALSENQR